MKGELRKSIINRLLLFLLILGAVLGVVLFRDSIWMRFVEVLASSDEDPVPVQFLQRVNAQITLSANGELAGMQTVPIPTPRVRSGALKIAWLIPEGSVVEAGDIVVRFDDTTAHLDLERLTNALTDNEYRSEIAENQQRTNDAALGIDIETASRDYDYSMSVLPEDPTIFSEWDIIEAKVDAQLAQERLENLKSKRIIQNRLAESERNVLEIEREKTESELAVARETLDSMELRAPASGLLLYRRNRGREPQIGDQSWAGQVLVEVVDVAALQARIFVLERDGGGLSVGKRANIRIDGIPEESFTGMLTSVSSLAQPLERNSPLRYFICTASIEGINPEMIQLWPGMALQADIILDTYDSCFVVPASAVASLEGEDLVYVQQGREFRPRPVSIVAAPPGRIVILSGVETGEAIALKDPFASMKLHLPDFSKGATAVNSTPRMGHRSRMR